MSTLEKHRSVKEVWVFYTNVYTIPFADVKAGNQVDAWAHNCGRGLESRNSTPLLSSPIISTSSLSLCLLRMLS